MWNRVVHRHPIDKKLERSGFGFHNEITTDGVAVSLLYSRPASRAPREELPRDAAQSVEMTRISREEELDNIPCSGKVEELEVQTLLQSQVQRGQTGRQDCEDLRRRLHDPLRGLVEEGPDGGMRSFPHRRDETTPVETLCGEIRRRIQDFKDGQGPERRSKHPSGGDIEGEARTPAEEPQDRRTRKTAGMGVDGPPRKRRQIQAERINAEEGGSNVQINGPVDAGPPSSDPTAPDDAVSEPWTDISVHRP